MRERGVEVNYMTFQLTPSIPNSYAVYPTAAVQSRFSLFILLCLSVYLLRALIRKLALHVPASTRRAAPLSAS